MSYFDDEAERPLTVWEESELENIMRRLDRWGRYLLLYKTEDGPQREAFHSLSDILFRINRGREHYGEFKHKLYDRKRHLRMKIGEL